MKPVRVMARRMRSDGADWRRVKADLPVPGLAAVVVVSGAAGPLRDRLAHALKTAAQPRAVPGHVAVLDTDGEAGDVRLLQFEGPSLRAPAAAVLWRWVLGVAMSEAARGAAGGLAVDVAAGDRAGNEAVKRWMEAAREAARAAGGRP